MRSCLDCRVEERLDFSVAHLPCETVEEMPGANCAYVVGDGVTCVTPCKGCNEAVDEDWCGRCTLGLGNLVVIAEDMVNQEA